MHIHKENVNDGWHGVITSSDSEVFGYASFKESSRQLKITCGSEELIVDNYGAFDSHSLIYYKGLQYGVFLRNQKGEIKVVDSSKKNIMLFTNDSFKRRKKWAYRQGFSLSQSNKYAEWGGILITRDIIISSIVAYGNWILPICEGCYPLFSKQDEQNVFTLDVFEQLIIIAVACHYLKVLPFYQPTISEEDLLDVKSFIKDEETGVLSINPSILPPRNAESFLLKYPYEISAIIVISIIYLFILCFWNFPETFTIRSYIIEPVMTFLLMNGIPGMSIFLQIVIVPYGDSEKDERLLYKKIKSILHR